LIMKKTTNEDLSLVDKAVKEPLSEITPMTENQSSKEKTVNADSFLKLAKRDSDDHAPSLMTIDLESPTSLKNSPKDNSEKENLGWYIKKSEQRAQASSYLSNPDKISRYHRVFWSISHGNEVTTIHIPDHRVAANVVFYEIVVSNDELRWNLWVRYSTFAYLHALMKDLVEGLGDKLKVDLPPFPDKRLKALTNHFSDSFIENRRALLENYVQKINEHRTLRYAEDFLIFLLPPRENLLEETGNYPVILRESLSLEPSDEEHKRSELKPTPCEPDNALPREKSTSITSNDRGAGNFMLFVNDADEITDIEINAVSVVDGPNQHHGVYHIVVKNSNKAEGFNKWIIMKRFLDFVKFDAEFRAELVEKSKVSVARLPNLPPKFNKSLTNHTDYAFMEKRRVLLQVYLRWLVRYPVFRRHRLLLEFLGVGKEFQRVVNGAN